MTPQNMLLERRCKIDADYAAEEPDSLEVIEIMSHAINGILIIQYLPGSLHCYIFIQVILYLHIFFMKDYAEFNSLSQEYKACIVNEWIQR